jgi:hypothetical protein
VDLIREIMLDIVAIAGIVLLVDLFVALLGIALS